MVAEDVGSMVRVPALRQMTGLLSGAAATLSLGLWATSAAADPSFDCSAATIPAEIAICDAPELAKLDQQIATVYFALLENLRPTLSAQIRHQQRAFLRERNACTAGDAPLELCLNNIMRQRLATLQQLHTDHAGAPLVSGGDVIGAPGVVWRAARPGEIPDSAFRTEDGQVLCAVGLPARPVIGVTSAGESVGCSIAGNGGAQVDTGFSILASGAVPFTWVPGRVSGNGPDGGLDVWRDGSDAVQVCRTVIAGETVVGTHRAGDACTVLAGSGAEAEVLLVLAGFDVLARVE